MLQEIFCTLWYKHFYLRLKLISLTLVVALHKGYEACIIQTCTRLSADIETIFTMTSLGTIDERTIAVETLAFSCQLKSVCVFITNIDKFYNKTFY